MAHNRVISTQAMARSKKNDSQTTICKLLLPKKWVCLQQPVLCRPTKNVRHCFILLSGKTPKSIKILPEAP